MARLCYSALDMFSDLYGCMRGPQRGERGDPNAELHRRANPAFLDALKQAHFSDIDRGKKGTFDFADFTEHFQGVATSEELQYVFGLLSKGQTHDQPVTFGAYEQLQIQLAAVAGGKTGCPQYLEYSSLLEGVVLSCSRFPLLERLKEAGEPFPPSPDWLMAEMGREWAVPALLPHWHYATNPVPEDAEDRQFPKSKGDGYDVRDTGHEGWTLEGFCAEPPAAAARLTVPEVLGLRLYTGPGFRALNLSLRANSQRFPATQFSIDSAIGKLARLASPEPLLRGMRGGMNPRWVRMYGLYRGVGDRKLALSEPAFCSATTSVEVATGKDFGGAVLFRLETAEPTVFGDFGFLRNGADTNWLSQYPTEAEVLLPSNLIIVPELRCKHRRRQQTAGIPSTTSVYDFKAFYPWDFTLNCPLVIADFLGCANTLIDVVHRLEVALADACHAGHPVAAADVPKGCAAPRSPAGESHCSLVLLAEEKSLFAESVESYDDLQHPSAPSLRPPPMLGSRGEATVIDLHTVGGPAGATHTVQLCDGVPPGLWAFGGRWGYADTVELPGALPAVGGSSALRLAKVRYYKESDVAAALEKFQARPRLTDGIEELTSVIPEFPPVAALFCPFENSVWNVGAWGIVVSSFGALFGGLWSIGSIGSIGVGGASSAATITTAVAATAAAAVTVTVATTVPILVTSPTEVHTPPSYPVPEILSSLFGQVETEVSAEKSLPGVAILLSRDLRPSNYNFSLVSDPFVYAVQTRMKGLAPLYICDWMGFIVDDSFADRGRYAFTLTYSSVQYTPLSLIHMRADELLLINDYIYFMRSGSFFEYTNGTSPVRSTSTPLTGWSLSIDDTDALLLVYSACFRAQNSTRLCISPRWKMGGLSADLRAQVANAPKDRLVVLQPTGQMVAASHGQIYNTNVSEAITIADYWNCTISDDTLIRTVCGKLIESYQSFSAFPEVQQTMVLNGEQYFVSVSHSNPGLPFIIVQVIAVVA